MEKNAKGYKYKYVIYRFYIYVNIQTYNVMYLNGIWLSVCIRTRHLSMYITFIHNNNINNNNNNINKPHKKKTENPF